MDVHSFRERQKGLKTQGRGKHTMKFLPRDGFFFFMDPSYDPFPPSVDAMSLGRSFVLTLWYLLLTVGLGCLP